MAYATLEQRREARETVARPGKFEHESPMVPILWDLCLDGFEDDSAGDATDGIGFMARIGRWILFLDTDGFVTGRRLRTVAPAEAEIESFRESSESALFGEEDSEEEETFQRCDQCADAMINGVYCHETGCPNARTR